MTGPLALGGDLYALGGLPGRVLAALERGGARGDSLIAAKCPDELIASSAIEELIAATDLAGLLGRAGAGAGEPAGAEDQVPGVRTGLPAAPPGAGAASSEAAGPASSDASFGGRTPPVPLPGSVATGPRGMATSSHGPRAGAEALRVAATASGPRIAGTEALRVAATASSPRVGADRSGATATSAAGAGGTATGQRATATSAAGAGGTATGRGATATAGPSIAAAATRAWLVAKAARTGAPDVIDRPLAITEAAGPAPASSPPATDAPAGRASRAMPARAPRRPLGELGSNAIAISDDRDAPGLLPARPSSSPSGIRSRPAGAADAAPIATEADRLSAMLDRIGAPGRAGSAISPRRTPRAPLGEIGSRVLDAAPDGRDQDREARRNRSRANQRAIAASEAVSDAASEATTEAGLDIAARATARPISLERAPRTAISPALARPAPQAVPPEPPLAEPPASPLRRFALLAEAAAPPVPGQVETTAPLGPRHAAIPAPAPAPAPAALDEVELAECLIRVLRREARRDGIDLDPPP